MNNGNPFNIRKNKANKWLGKKPSWNSFEAFISDVHGTRAFILLIANYRYKWNIYTIETIINRYAPPIENDTKNYIQFVCKEMKLPPFAEITHNNLFEFAKAVAKMESNYTLSKETFEKALNLINRK